MLWTSINPKVLAEKLKSNSKHQAKQKRSANASPFGVGASLGEFTVKYPQTTKDYEEVYLYKSMIESQTFLVVTAWKADEKDWDLDPTFIVMAGKYKLLLRDRIKEAYRVLTGKVTQGGPEIMLSKESVMEMCSELSEFIAAQEERIEKFKNEQR